MQALAATHADYLRAVTAAAEAYHRTLEQAASEFRHAGASGTGVAQPATGDDESYYRALETWQRRATDATRAYQSALDAAGSDYRRDWVRAWTDDAHRRESLYREAFADVATSEGGAMPLGTGWPSMPAVFPATTPAGFSMWGAGGWSGWPAWQPWTAEG
jgi:hypothetical protein